MGYHTNIAIDVDVLTRSIEINIKNKEKNTENLIKNIQKNMLPPAGGRIRSQGNYYCLPPAGVLHSQNKVINAP